LIERIGPPPVLLSSVHFRVVPEHDLDLLRDSVDAAGWALAGFRKTP
jgi:hypothetical protein